MVRSLWEGIILGVTLAFLIGPAFISLIQTSIHRGLRSGLLFAVGILFSDLTLIALSYLGAVQFLSRESNQFWVGIVGGSVLIIFGLVNLLKKYDAPRQPGIEVKVSVSGGGAFKYILKGFLMNILNPFLLIFWLGVMSFISAKYGIESREVLMFFAGALSAVFLTDTLKCLIANRIRKYLNLKILTWVNRLVGLALIIFGIVMYIRAYINFN